MIQDVFIKLDDLKKDDAALAISGNLDVFHVQMVDKQRKKMVLYYKDFVLYAKYKFEWNLDLNKVSYMKFRDKFYYSPIFYGLFYLVYTRKKSNVDWDCIGLKVCKLPVDISSIFVKWGCVIQKDENVVMDQVKFLTLKLGVNNHNNGWNISGDKWHEEVDAITVKRMRDEFAIKNEIEILQVRDRNDFSNSNNVIMRENLELYGIHNAECDDNVNNDDNRFMEKVINNVVIKGENTNNGWGGGWNVNENEANPPTKAILDGDDTDYKENRHNHTINCIAKKLRDDYDGKINVLQMEHEKKISILESEVNELKAMIQSLLTHKN